MNLILDAVKKFVFKDYSAGFVRPVNCAAFCCCFEQACFLVESFQAAIFKDYDKPPAIFAVGTKYCIVGVKSIG